MWCVLLEDSRQMSAIPSTGVTLTGNGTNMGTILLGTPKLLLGPCWQ